MTVKKYKICLKCQKPLHKAPRTGCSTSSVPINPQSMGKNRCFRRTARIPIKDGEYQLEIHKVCYEDLDNIALTEVGEESSVSIINVEASEDIETAQTDEMKIYIRFNF